MNDEERIEELLRREEIPLMADSGFDAVRKHDRNQKVPEKEIRRSDYLRAVEDAVEQNDNSFDGIINNLPEEATGSVSGYADEKIKEERKSLVEEIRKQAEAVLPPLPSNDTKVPCFDGRENML